MSKMWGPNPYRVEGDCIFIKLTQGQEAVIDKDDYERIRDYHWSVAMLKRVHRYYVSTRMPGIGRNRFAMHQLLVKPDKDFEVDYIDGNPLNNRRNNVQIIASGLKRHNERTVIENKCSDYRGVSLDKYSNKNKWMCQITTKNEDMYLGRFDTQEEAAKAYDKYAKEIYGDLAKLNFPDGEV